MIHWRFHLSLFFSTAETVNSSSSRSIFYAPSSPDDVECVIDAEADGVGGERNLTGSLLVVEEAGQEVTEDEALVYRSDGKKVYPCQFCGKVSFS